ncbi:hypothetical protein [Psychromicrobium sp. YIM B11713]|uniref:hypothetical protein n=1 Tax=Psychromicrobium sp. YIM B11713 TaxID=3145233 RepID=UPI00374F831A
MSNNSVPPYGEQPKPQYTPTSAGPYGSPSQPQSPPSQDQASQYQPGQAPVPPQQWQTPYGSPDSQQQYAQQPASPFQAPPRKNRRGLLIGLLSGGLALVLVLVIGGIWFANASSQNAPEQQVKAFLQALVDGKAEQAMKLSHTELSEADRLLVNDEVYSAAQSRITDYSIGKVVVKDGKATVSAEYSQAGKTTLKDFTLSSAGKDFLVDKWQLDPIDLPSVKVKLAGPVSSGLSLGGVGLSPELVAGTGPKPAILSAMTVKALPGDYRLAPKNQDPAVTVEEQTVKVRGFDEEPGSYTLKSVLTAAGKAAITAAVSKYLDDCAAQNALVPKGCPFSGKLTGQLVDFKADSVRWSLTAKPTLKIGEWSELLGWTVLSNKDGNVNGTVHVSNGSVSGNASIKDLKFGVIGTVAEIKDGQAKFNRVFF